MSLKYLANESRHRSAANATRMALQKKTITSRRCSGSKMFSMFSTWWGTPLIFFQAQWGSLSAKTLGRIWRNTYVLRIWAISAVYVSRRPSAASARPVSEMSSLRYAHKPQRCFFDEVLASFPSSITLLRAAQFYAVAIIKTAIKHFPSELARVTTNDSFSE